MSSTIKRRETIHQQLRYSKQRIEALEEQLAVSQKLASLGTMACLIAHEFNNLLVPIVTYSDLALRNKDDHSLAYKALSKSLQNGTHAADMINSLLNYAKNNSTVRTKSNVAELVAECFKLLTRDFTNDCITVLKDIPDDLMIESAKPQLQQGFINLIINARQAMIGRGGTLRITAKSRADNSIIIEVSDTGCGIAADMIDRIFEPFFSTKTSPDSDQPDQQGTGLGLSLCKDMIETHSGKISVTSKLGVGTTFTIIIPQKTVNPEHSECVASIASQA